MLLAHALMRLSMTSAAPAGSTLFAEAIDRGGSFEGIMTGYDATEGIGSITPNPINDYEFIALYDLYFEYLVVDIVGNRMADLAGKSLWIDGTPFSFDENDSPFGGMVYYGDDGYNYTEMAWNRPAGFVDYGTYIIDVR